MDGVAEVGQEEGNRTQPLLPAQAPLRSRSLLDHSRTCDDLRRASAGLSLQDRTVRWGLPGGRPSALHPGAWPAGSLLPSLASVSPAVKWGAPSLPEGPAATAHPPI